MLWSADTYSQTKELITIQMLLDRFQPIVSLQSSPSLYSQRTIRKLKVVMNHQDVVGLEMKEIKGGTNCLSTLIHIGLRPEQADRAFTGELCMKFCSPREVGKVMVANHPGDVVPGSCILPSGVAQKYH